VDLPINHASDCKQIERDPRSRVHGYPDTQIIENKTGDDE